MDPFVQAFTGILFTILVIGLVLRYFKVPYVMAYLFAGVVIGPYGVGVIKDHSVLVAMESIGVHLLLFFVGMKVSTSELVSNWKVEVGGTFFQILVSLLCVTLLGYWLDWSTARIVLLSFVISISSTAVVIKILEDRKQIATYIGKSVVGILLVQDLALIPMMIIIELMGGIVPSRDEVMLQIIGGAGIIALLIWLAQAKCHINVPFSNFIRKNHEIQVFVALLICFGVSFITELFNLSGAIGAFIAGIIVSTARETDWVSKSLQPFYILFVALFFVSIGMLIDIIFFVENWLQILLLVAATLITNTFINAFILKALGVEWRQSLYGGGLLSQIGEFSFVLVAIGLQAAVIGEFEHQLAIYIIAFTLLLCPIWIAFIEYFAKPHQTVLSNHKKKKDEERKLKP